MQGLGLDPVHFDVGIAGTIERNDEPTRCRALCVCALATIGAGDGLQFAESEVPSRSWTCMASRPRAMP